jgi:alanyl-tRNA synthetase
MQNITEYLYEHLNEADDAKIKELEDKVNQAEKDAKAAKKKADDADKEASKAAESIKDEKSFRDYAENKFKEVFGDKLDEKKMKETIDGILSDNKDAVEAGDWGELVGILNKSFGK